MAIKFVVVLTVIALMQEVSSHGMMLDPPNRASVWRYYERSPTDYDDNAFNCGGFGVQYSENSGKCGICGDNYADPVPRSNENGGTYGNGVVLKKYTSGAIITTSITLTANHRGTFTYSLCKLSSASELESEECFTDLRLADGSAAYNVAADDYIIHNQVQLPAGVTCDRCVFRWHYKSGNSWGVCSDGTQKMGCGAQETFRSCADITITDA